MKKEADIKLQRMVIMRIKRESLFCHRQCVEIRKIVKFNKKSREI